MLTASLGWLTRFLTSSIGQKLVMSLTGIFMILFLIIHLLGNLQLLATDEGESFNTYAYFMTHNPVIKLISYTLYASILLHAILGIALWQQNRQASGGSRYAVHHTRANERPSRNMAWLGIVIFVFIVLHMYQFWFQMHWGGVPTLTYPGLDYEVKNLYGPVAETFSNGFFVAFYVISMVVIAFHLWHGFWSSLQTLGLNHRKYNPIIVGLGWIYAIVIPALFALIPVWFFFTKAQ
jgi:succinate dehydrogenase / fumarate reductase cytochrome b subunit